MAVVVTTSLFLTGMREEGRVHVLGGILENVVFCMGNVALLAVSQSPVEDS
jgi:hypothetical protein